MAEVWVPALLRDLTGGQERVSAAGETVREVIDALEERYPGMRERLCEDGRLRPNIAWWSTGRSAASACARSWAGQRSAFRPRHWGRVMFGLERRCFDAA